jgi:hypothetical protein
VTISDPHVLLRGLQDLDDNDEDGEGYKQFAEECQGKYRDRRAVDALI